MSAITDAITWLNDPLNWTNPDGIVVRLGEHLWIAGASIALGCAVAWPIGLWLGHIGRGGQVLTSLANVTRAIPIIALLMILPLTKVGFGQPAIILSLAFFTFAPLLSDAYLGVRQVDPEVRDAARGMGLNPWQVLFRVELPLAVPYLAAGFRTTAVQVVATTTLASFVNGGGLGMIISRGFGLGMNAGGGQLLAGGLLVALLCLAVEALLAVGQRLVTPAPLRARAPLRTRRVVINT
ncbi:osmoprotectant transport system permease protein [Allocatelliglobosispora scoriae]|uniref:Osmoprotectant transport system permease protein n=1 Tax=Allocatelliglobosispora scoriae TaxID=643052 RepID=A0A841BWE0_9ACTN|nr:ABC transporter permease [Allocatelliglobosispora scoriae]MBB5872474.1 osmoprotectant transport system permease protein [Allocatelliglobosispora scoriae]